MAQKMGLMPHHLYNRRAVRRIAPLSEAI